MFRLQKNHLLLSCVQMNRNSLIWHILLDITTFIFRVHQGSIFHISEPMYHEILGGGGRIVLMKQAVFIKEKKRNTLKLAGEVISRSGENEFHREKQMEKWGKQAREKETL